MTRLEKSKNRLTDVKENLGDNEKLTLIFQELINQLPTYKEQKELYVYFEKMKKRNKKG